MANDNGFYKIPDYNPNGPVVPSDQQGPLYQALLAQGASSPRPDLAAFNFAQQNWKPKKYTTADLVALGANADNPVDGMSATQRLAAGIGQGFTDADLHTAQFLSDNPVIAHMAGYGYLASPEMKLAIAQKVAEKQQLDAPLMATTAGKTGSIVGETALLAPLVP